MAKKHAWYICPNCRSRLSVEHDHAGEVRCRNCSTLLRPAKHSASASPKQRDAGRHARDDDEYRLAPLADDQTISSQGQLVDPAAAASASDLQDLRTRRERSSAAKSAGKQQTAITAAGPLRLDEIETRDDERYKPEPPPRWTFFSGVFLYPWRPQSLLPWMVLSIGTALCEWSGLLVLSGLASSSQPGALAAGAFGIVWLWLVILTGSYAAACLFAIMETTAYNFDAPYDWPDPDWRERFVHLLWMGWCFGLAAALVAPPSAFLSDNLQGRALASAIGIGLLFPVFVLSTLETNSLSPISTPIWRSLVSEFAAWISFYVLGGLLLAGAGWASVEVFRWLQWLSPLVLGPLWAATILIYSRLLGRLAWRIMQPGELQLEAWRKSRQSTLAGELRQQQREEGGLFDE
jgi:hypothetical protein